MFAAVAGFLFASRSSFDVVALVSLTIGLSLVIASACVLNNVLDRNIDQNMSRTKNRALVTGAIKVSQALIFAVILGVSGSVLLALYCNVLSLLVALFGVFMYVIVYGYAKRTTSLSTLIGSISGAIPPVVGYTAAGGMLDISAMMLFVLFAVWQMPHFYAISIFRTKDYKNAGLPVMSVEKGITATVRQIFVFIIIFIAACIGLYVASNASVTFLVASLVLGGYWLYKAYSGPHKTNPEAWARMVFGVSLIVLIIISVLLAVDRFLP